MDPNQIQFLQKQGYPPGMIRALAAQKQSFPLRVWILDNSLSMLVKDAHILRGNYQNLDATRWEELQDCVAYHTLFSATFRLPVRFAMLNDPNIIIPGGVSGGQYFSLNQTGNLELEQHTLQRVMAQTRPNGPTLLTKQLNVLREYVVSIAPQLRAQNQTVPIILATQGLPTNEQSISSPQVLGEFIMALRSFEHLPVWVVMRLCTDDEKAFEFYNSIDAQLNLPCDVLDDFYGEALEIYLRNPWLTYGIPLHRYREMGFRVHVLDILDQRALTPAEVRDLCAFLFAPQMPLPDIMVDWNGFLRVVSEAMAKEQPQWNPITKSATPWINLAHLDALYGGRCRAAPQPPPPRAPSQPNNTVPPYPQPPLHQSAPVQPPTVTTSQPPSMNVRATPIQDSTALKLAISKQWAKQPPAFTINKPIAELLGTVDVTFPLVDPHEYFQEKYHPFSAQALKSGDEAVLKRGTFLKDCNGIGLFMCA
jgi:hypothetical protein